jgi:hypothetical protein
MQPVQTVHQFIPVRETGIAVFVQVVDHTEAVGEYMHLIGGIAARQPFFA